jgi:MAP/microtubule affinity-regulating kinase
MMFRQVVRGLRYLHEDALLVHRDMKLENVLVDESGVCRIGDFGLSVKIGQSQVDEDDMWEDEHIQQEAGAAGYNAVHRAFSLSLPKRPGKIVASGLNPIARHNSARRSATNNTKPQSHVHQPGSLPYAAPELLLPQSAELALPHPSQDIWALGVMLYALLAGHLPFKDSFEPRLQMKILNGMYRVAHATAFELNKLYTRCL